MELTTWPTITEVSDRLGLSRQRVHALLQHGRIEGIKRGAQWLLNPESVDRLEAERTARQQTIEQAQ